MQVGLSREQYYGTMQAVEDAELAERQASAAGAVSSPVTDESSVRAECCDQAVQTDIDASAVESDEMAKALAEANTELQRQVEQLQQLNQAQQSELISLRQQLEDSHAMLSETSRQLELAEAQRAELKAELNSTNSRRLSGSSISSPLSGSDDQSRHTASRSSHLQVSASSSRQRVSVNATGTPAAHLMTPSAKPTPSSHRTPQPKSGLLSSFMSITPQRTPVVSPHDAELEQVESSDVDSEPTEPMQAQPGAVDQEAPLQEDMVCSIYH